VLLANETALMVRVGRDLIESGELLGFDTKFWIAL
jgi:hypothetical protein